MGLDCEFLGVYIQTWLLFDMPVVVVCLKTCNYCVTASKHCWFQCCTNSSPEVPQLFFFFCASRGEADGQVFLCIVAGNFFYFFFLSPVMEGELCKRGESSHRPSLFLFFSMSQCLPA